MEAWLIVTSSSTPSAPITIPARSSPWSDTSAFTDLEEDRLLAREAGEMGEVREEHREQRGEDQACSRAQESRQALRPDAVGERDRGEGHRHRADHRHEQRRVPVQDRRHHEDQDDPEADREAHERQRPAPARECQDHQHEQAGEDRASAAAARSPEACSPCRPRPATPAEARAPSPPGSCPRGPRPGRTRRRSSWSWIRLPFSGPLSIVAVASWHCWPLKPTQSPSSHLLDRRLLALDRHPLRPCESTSPGQSRIRPTTVATASPAATRVNTRSTRLQARGSPWGRPAPRSRASRSAGGRRSSGPCSRSSRSPGPGSPTLRWRWRSSTGGRSSVERLPVCCTQV